MCDLVLPAGPATPIVPVVVPVVVMVVVVLAVPVVVVALVAVAVVVPVVVVVTVVVTRLVGILRTVRGSRGMGVLMGGVHVWLTSQECCRGGGRRSTQRLLCAYSCTNAPVGSHEMGPLAGQGPLTGADVRTCGLKVWADPPAHRCGALRWGHVGE